jgi:hypothetical protein
MFGGFAEEAAGVALDLNSQSGAMIAFGAARARPAGRRPRVADTATTGPGPSLRAGTGKAD